MEKKLSRQSETEMARKILAIITAATKDRVIIGEAEVKHALEDHFQLFPQDILLELIERILKKPTVVYEEQITHRYLLFYKLDNGKYLVVVIKTLKNGVYFSSIYPTGKQIRTRHKRLKKVIL